MSLAQKTELGCISIDFEQIPGEENLFEGLSIGDQFEGLFGLTFEIEGGGIPVLAQVGPPAAAFGGNFGNDTPAPDQGIGDFFITDDGILSGLSSPPLVLRFDTPIDSFAGCILDMDFDETFVIHARDSLDNILLADTIRAGDPGTGDALATCWGFNLPTCIGTIYSIRFAGSREANGAFGLGLDNFSFCYSGINISSENSEANCHGEGGSLEVFSTSNENYLFSLDGVNFGTNGVFEDLVPDIYEVFVRDENGCETSVEIEISQAEQPQFVDLIVNNTRCAENNGSISFDIMPDYGAVYTLDGGSNYSDVSEFNDLSPGSYLLEALDENLCTDQIPFDIAPSSAPQLNVLDIVDETCLENDGQVSLSATDGQAPYQYALLGNDFDSNATLTDIPGGEQMVVVRDSFGCLDSVEVDIEPYPTIEFGNPDTLNPICLTDNGEITINVTGGLGELDFFVDNQVQDDPHFEGLQHSWHYFGVIDEIGCEKRDSVFLAIPLCPVFVPNIISPNGDNYNDEFIISVNPDYPAEIINYWIYDRWGELVHHSNNYSIHTRSNALVNNQHVWWDGYFKEKPAETGVYVYLIELRHENGEIAYLSGDVTLVR